MSNRLENRMRGYPTFNELRKKQIDEVLDYDKNISRRVFILEKEAVKVFGDVYKPPTILEKSVVFNIDKFIATIKSELLATAEDVDMFNDNEPKNISSGKEFRSWDEMISYIKNYASLNQLPERDYDELFNKLDNELYPVLDYIEVKGMPIDNEYFFEYPLYIEMKNKIVNRDLSVITTPIDESYKLVRPNKGRGKYKLYCDTQKPFFNYNDERNDNYLKK